MTGLLKANEMFNYTLAVRSFGCKPLTERFIILYRKNKKKTNHLELGRQKLH